MSDFLAGASAKYGTDGKWLSDPQVPSGRIFVNPSNILPGNAGYAAVASQVGGGPTTYVQWIDVTLPAARSMGWCYTKAEVIGAGADHPVFYASDTPLDPEPPTHAYTDPPLPTPLTAGWDAIAGTWLQFYTAPGVSSLDARDWIFIPDDTAAAYPYWAGVMANTTLTNPEGVREIRWYDWDGVTGGDPAPPTPGIDVVVYDPDDVLLAELGDASEKWMKKELNATGAGHFKINRYSPNATPDILRGGNFVRVTIPRIDPDPIFGFFLNDESIKLVSNDESGAEDYEINGLGELSYLGRPVWLAQSFVEPWWISGTPAAGDIGQIEVDAGSHVRYIISSGTIASTTGYSVGAFTAFYDQRKSFRFASGHGTLTRLLVHLSSGPNAGWWLHIFDDGYTDHYSNITINNTILLTSIGDGDKPGQVLYRMCQEALAADRPTHPVPGLTVDFTDTTDSDGNPWTTTDALIGMTAELGEPYLTTIGTLLGTGVLDVVMTPDLVLHAYNHYGRNLTGASFGAGVVRFAKGVNIADELVRELNPAPVATWAQIVGTDGVVATAELADAASRIPRETSLRGETNDATALAALGLAELQRQLVASDATGFRTRTDADDEGTGRYLPGPDGTAHGKYWIGDDVTLHTGTADQDFNETSVRMAAVTIAEDEARNLEVTPEIGAVFGGSGLVATAGGSGTGPFASTIPTSSSSPVALDDLIDVDTTGKAADDVLTWDGAAWFPAPPAPTGFVTTTNGGGETIKAHGSMGAAETFDPADGNIHTGTLTADCLVTLGAPVGSDGATLEAWITQDGTGGWALTIDCASGGTFQWDGATPTLPTTAGVSYRIVFERAPGTTNDWIGNLVGGGSTVAALDDLTDVNAPTPSDQDVLTWDATASEWIAQAVTVPAVTEADVRDAGRWEPVMMDGALLLTDAGDLIEMWIGA